jgi:hypothetical protein
MSRKHSSAWPAALGVALLTAVSLGACRTARQSDGAAGSTGARSAPAESASVGAREPAAANTRDSAAVGLQDSAAVSLQRPPYVKGPPPRPPETFPMEIEPRQGQDTSRARYPKAWEVNVPPGTPLDTLRREMDAQFAILPPADLEDRTPLPIWFRVYLRKKNPDLPTKGPYQYPRTARRVLQWMLAHPDSVEH